MARLSKKRERELLERTNYAKISVALGFEHTPEVFAIVIPVKPVKEKRKKS